MPGHYLESLIGGAVGHHLPRRAQKMHRAHCENIGQIIFEHKSHGSHVYDLG